MFTRNDYMFEKCTFEQYWDQYVSAQILARVYDKVGIDRLMNASDRRIFSDIPLEVWDDVARSFNIKPGTALRMKFDECLDFPSLSGLVCIAKMAARQLCSCPRALVADAR